MDRDVIECGKQIIKLREKVLQAEQERVNGAKTYSVLEARKRLRKRYADNS